MFCIRKDGAKSDASSPSWMGQRMFSDMTEAELLAMIDKPWPPEGYAGWSLADRANYMDFHGTITSTNRESAHKELARRAVPALTDFPASEPTRPR